MENEPIKCICCDNWNLPDAKFCRNCGADLEDMRKLQQIEKEVDMRMKILEEWGVTEEEDESYKAAAQQKSGNGGCASVIILLVAVAGVISLCI